MLKQKIDTAALFAQKKTEVQSSARTLLILDGQENAYISADELTEELLAIPEEGAIWLDMSLFGSHDQVMTVARSFKLSPATQNILENKKQQPHSCCFFLAFAYSRSIFAYNGLSCASLGAVLRGTSLRIFSLDTAGFSSKHLSLL